MGVSPKLVALVERERGADLVPAIRPPSCRCGGGGGPALSLTYQRESAESRFLAAILLIGIASAVAYSAFLIRRERIKNRFLLLWILVITPLLTIPALRLLFIASGRSSAGALPLPGSCFPGRRCICLLFPGFLPLDGEK